MYSVLYEADGSIFKIGPFDTRKEAEEAAKNGQIKNEDDLTGEFDIMNQNVYLMTPDHQLIPFSIDDLIPEAELVDED